MITNVAVYSGSNHRTVAATVAAAATVALKPENLVKKEVKNGVQELGDGSLKRSRIYMNYSLVIPLKHHRHRRHTVYV